MVATQQPSPPELQANDGRAVAVGSLSMGAISTFVFTVLATIVSEESSGFKSFLTDLTGHHWVSKSLLSLLVFLVATAVSYPVIKRRSFSLVTWSVAVAGTALVGMFVIFFFFVGFFISES